MRALTVPSAMERGERNGDPRAPLRLVAFDMDGVLIDHVSSWAAVHDAIGTKNPEGLKAFLAGTIDDREFIRADVRLWRQARPALKEADLRAILAEVPRMPGLHEALGELRSAGTTCAIITGGLRAMAEMLAAEAGFEHIRANNVVFGPDGRLEEGAVIEVPMRDKASVLRKLQAQLHILHAETGSVGDSAFDRGLFERSRIGVAFNPLDAEVVRAATHVVREKDLKRAVAPLLMA